MGCDIHWNTEVLKNGKWVCEQVIARPEWADSDDEMRLEDFPGRDRNYWLFGTLAKGVRTDYPWSFPYQNKKPVDASPEVTQRIEDDGDDGHSHGYWTRQQLQAKLDSFATIRAEYLITPLDDSQAHYPKVLAQLTEDFQQILDNMGTEVPATEQRLVFWFDN